MQKAIILSLSLIALLLFSVLILLPRTSLAAAAPASGKITITTLDKSDCSQMQPDNAGYIVSYQTCVVTLSTNQPQPVHFATSINTTLCAYSGCQAYTHSTDAQVVYPDGTTIKQYFPVHVLLITPVYVLHGSEEFTFRFTGPANTVRAQIVTINAMGG